MYLIDSWSILASLMTILTEIDKFINVSTHITLSFIHGIIIIFIYNEHSRA